MRPTTADAYKLFHEGTLALSTLERNGVAIDVEYLDKSIADTTRQIRDVTAKLRETDVFETWRKVFGPKTKLSSPQQLGHVLFKVMGFPCRAWTDASMEEGVAEIDKRPKTNEEALKEVRHPFVEDYLQMRKLKKVRDTFLFGLKNELADGKVHAFFGLNINISYRGQSDTPNLQNQPIRDPMMADFIRRCYIPRKKHWRFTEIDYSGIEVKVAGARTKDPRLLKYIKDPTTDMHRDMAAQCYKMKESEVDKMVRYCAKNMFVFPEFYGSWYLNCCQSLWNAIARLKLMSPGTTDEPLYEHLKRQGIKKLGACVIGQRPKKGTFEHHIKTCEEDFWGNRFKVYTEWKEEQWQEYLSKGWFDAPTGFVWEGLFNKKEVINYQIQGPAFQCLLLALIEILKRIRKYKMKTKPCITIHDSIIGDGPEKESMAFAEICVEVMTKWVPKQWRWIIVPLTAEVEMAPPGMSWRDKQKVEMAA